MTQSSIFKNLLSSAIQHIITSDDIIAYDDNFVLAITTNKKLVYLSSINDLSMMHIEANNEGFVLPFEAHNEAYTLVASGFSSSYTLDAAGNQHVIFETLNTGFICYTVPENTAYSIQHPPQANGCLNLMLLNEEMSELQTTTSPGVQVIDVLRKEFDFEIGRVLKNLKDNLNKNKLDYIIYKSHMFQLYGIYLMRFHKAQSSIEDKNFSKLDIKVAKAAAIIESDLAAFISVKDIAQKVSINQAALQQGFKQSFGTTINEFVRQKRLDKASELLRSTTLDVSEIVYKVGLNSRSYFSEIFRKEYEMTPTVFRKQFGHHS